MRMKRRYKMQRGGPVTSKPGSFSKPVTNEPETAGFLERAAYKHIVPYGYNFKENFSPAAVAEYHAEVNKQRKADLPMRDRFESNRDDAWRTYLGMQPQGKSLIKTRNGYQLNPELEEDILRDAVHTDVAAVKSGNAIKNSAIEPGSYRHIGNEDRWVDVDMAANIMGNYTVAKGQDKQGNYIRYRDKWDLSPTVLGMKIPVDAAVGKPYEIGNKIYYDPKTNKRIQQQGGEADPGVIIERGEIAKQQDGTIVQVDSRAPSHDDPKLASIHGVERVQGGKGGVLVHGLESVLSDSQSQINSGDRTNNVKDAVIKIRPDEARAIAESLNLTLGKGSSRSPTKLFMGLQTARDKQARKYTLPKKYSTQSGKEFENSQHVNAVQQKQLADDTALYDHVFEIQEAAKQQVPGYEDMPNQNMQHGGAATKTIRRNRFLPPEPTTTPIKQGTDFTRSWAAKRAASGFMGLTPQDAVGIDTPMGETTEQINSNPLVIASSLIRGKLPGPTQGYNNKITGNSIIATDIPAKDQYDTAVHESTHDWQNQINGNHTFLGFGKSPINQSYDVINAELIRSGRKDDLYFGDPSEVHARVMEGRASLKLRPGQVVTQQHLQRLRRINPSAYRGLNKVLDDQGKLNSFNKTVAVDPVVITDSNLTYSQQGGSCGALSKYL